MFLGSLRNWSWGLLTARAAERAKSESAHVSRKDPDSDFSMRAELYDQVQWKKRQKIQCPPQYTWSAPPDGSGLAARLTLTAGDSEAAGVQRTHCHVEESGGGWLSLATLSSWKSASADRWRAAAAEGWGVASGGRRCQRKLQFAGSCRIQSRARKYGMQPEARFDGKVSQSERRHTWHHVWFCAADAGKERLLFFPNTDIFCKMLLQQVVIWVAAAFSVTQCQSGHSALATRRNFLPEENCSYLCFKVAPAKSGHGCVHINSFVEPAAQQLQPG